MPKRSKPRQRRTTRPYTHSHRRVRAKAQNPFLGFLKLYNGLQNWWLRYQRRRHTLAATWNRAVNRWLHRHRVTIAAYSTAVLLFIGLQLMTAGGWYLLYKQTILSFKVSPIVTAEAQLRHSRPQRIKIPGSQIDLSILPTGIVDGVWQTSEAAATHLVTSAHPGEGGNIVIYGHNKSHLFGPLHTTKEGDMIEIQTEDGALFEYRVNRILTVKPDQVEVVLPADHEVLTVYTCTGFFDSQRLVIQAVPTRVASGS